ncbi:MAG: hypothetical protein ABJ360_21010 [Roseobacter sp.]
MENRVTAGSMNDITKGLMITTIAVLLIVPDSLFVRLIDADSLTISFWRLFLPGFALGAGLLLTRGIAPFALVLGTGKLGLLYITGIGASGVLFVLAVSLTSVANVVFIIASLPVFLQPSTAGFFWRNGLGPGCC